jgi:NADPH:quinone reductase-like Zn-dependent oxidoreductase
MPDQNAAAPQGTGPTAGRTRAAIIDGPGAAPHIGEMDLPHRGAAMTLVQVLAAPLNPLDLVMASGNFPAGRHDRPYVPGVECTGAVIESGRYPAGATVFVDHHPSPAAPGCLAAQMVVSDDAILPVPSGLDPARAAAVGNAGIAAFLPLVEVAALRPGETVLILGATGAVGQLAVQIARHHGAGRIIAVGRDAAALQRVRGLGAHDVVELRPEDDEDTLAQRLGAAGPSVEVVLDGLSGVPLQAALRVCAPNARVVNVGNPAGATMQVPAALLRSRQLALIGFASFLTPLARKRAALEWMWAALSRDELHVDLRTFSLAEIAVAWKAQQTSPHAKCVVVPDATSPA